MKCRFRHILQKKEFKKKTCTFDNYFVSLQATTKKLSYER